MREREEGCTLVYFLKEEEDDDDSEMKHIRGREIGRREGEASSRFRTFIFFFFVFLLLLFMTSVFLLLRLIE